MAKKEEILKIFPKEPRTTLGQAPVDPREMQEICLGSGKPMIMICKNREYLATRESRFRQDQDGLDMNGFLIVIQFQMKETVEYTSSFPLYAAEEELGQKFLTIQGGHRTGVMGKALVQGQDIRLMKFISFINIRVTHEILGYADPIMDYLYMDRFLNILIISPPRRDRTILLRDIIRQVSNGRSRGRWIPGMSTDMMNERSELATCYQGTPQNDLGVRTDVLDCCPKSQGIMMLVHTMAPEVIAVDEIGSCQDMEAIEYIGSCGCPLTAITHGNSLEGIGQKPCMGELLAQGTFERLTLLDGWGEPGHMRSIWGRGENVLYGEKGPGSQRERR